MGEENRTLTFSEQKAHEGVLRLAGLGMVPSYSWRAVNMGRVENDGFETVFGGAWKIKKRQVVFEWNWKRRGANGTLILIIVLRAEIPLSPREGEGEIQSEEAQRRWFIVGIKIFWIGEEINHPEFQPLFPPEFEIKGESDVDILFNKLDSEFLKQ